jgi:hypothetical protein
MKIYSSYVSNKMVFVPSTKLWAIEELCLDGASVRTQSNDKSEPIRNAFGIWNHNLKDALFQVCGWSLKSGSLCVCMCVYIYLHIIACTHI